MINLSAIIHINCKKKHQGCFGDMVKAERLKKTKKDEDSKFTAP